MRSALVAASLATLARGHLLYTYGYDESPAYAITRSWDSSESMTRSAWRMSPEHYTVKIQTPAVEEGSVTASLSLDGAMLNINAKRYIQGCSCQESTVGQVRLPHTPRAEDVDLTHDPKTGVVSVKVMRHAKVDEPRPLPVKTLEPDAAAESRGFRFVPHKSAMPSGPQEEASATSDTDEKRLLDKFRAIAVAAKNSRVNEPDRVKSESTPVAEDKSIVQSAEA